MKNLLLIMTFLSSLFGAKAQQTDAIKILNSTEYQSAITTKNVQLVDVRTANEFKQGSICKALNIDFFKKEDFNINFEKLDKEQPVYLFCRSGARSQKAAAKLIAMGFTKIYDLKGGYMSWPFKKQ